MRDRLNSKREASRRRTAAEVIDALEEDLKDALDIDDIDYVDDGSTVPIEENCENCENCKNCENCDDATALKAEADAFLASVDGTDLPDAEPCVSEEHEVINCCNEVEKQIARIETAEKEQEQKKAEAKEASEILASCDEIERRIVAAERKASTVEKGIEDRIGDQKNGGQPSVSSLAKTKVETGTRKEVFGTNSRSQYVASITRRLDRVADILEKQGKIKMAFRIDRLADAIEQEANRH